MKNILAMGPVWIVKKNGVFTSIYECDYNRLVELDEEHTVELIEKYPYWSELVRDRIEKLNNTKKEVFQNKAHIVFDGEKFFGIYVKDFDQYSKKHPNVEIWETWSEWTTEMDETIKTYNQNL